LGDHASFALIEQMTASAEVVAVAMDFGGTVSLSDLRDLALAAGARRCHALDVREEFLRECVLPAMREGGADRAFADPAAVEAALAPEFATRKLHEIAAIEHATLVVPAAVPQAVRAPRAPGVPPRHLDIAFEDGIPVAINGVPMSLVELLESLETITGEAALTVIERHLATLRAPQLT
jgi:argininosuccinate synthase